MVCTFYVGEIEWREERNSLGVRNAYCGKEVKMKPCGEPWE